MMCGCVLYSASATRNAQPGASWPRGERPPPPSSAEHRRGRPIAALGGQQLVAHEGGVERVGVGGQLLVRAALDGGALVQYDDLVGAHDGREAVCDDDGGLALHEQVERGLYDGLVGGVEGGGGLVEEEHRRVLEDGARDGDTLLLPAADAHPLLARLGLVALG